MRNLKDIEERGIEINTIYNCDCLEAMRLMKDKSIDLVLTDPPYGINVGKPIKRERERESVSELPQSHLVRVGVKGKSRPKVIGDSMTPESPPKSILMRCSELARTRLYLEEIIL